MPPTMAAAFTGAPCLSAIGGHPAARDSVHEDVPHIDIAQRLGQSEEGHDVVEICSAQLFFALSSIIAPILRCNHDKPV